MLIKSNQSKSDIENRQMQNKPFQETMIHVENNMYDYIKYYCFTTEISGCVEQKVKLMGYSHVTDM